MLGADPGFLIAQNPDTVRAPDVAFLQAQRVGERLPKGFFPGRPIWPSRSFRRAIGPAKCSRRCRIGSPPAALPYGWSIR